MIRKLTEELVNVQADLEKKFHDLLTIVHDLEQTEGIDQLYICNAKLKLLTAKMDLGKSFPWYTG